MSVAFRQAVEEKAVADMKGSQNEEKRQWMMEREVVLGHLAQSNAPPKTERSAPLRLVG